MNKLKDIISPGHRELDEILYNNPKKSPSPQQATPKRSLSQRVRSVGHQGKDGSPDSTANGSMTNPSVANDVAPPPPPPAQSRAQPQQQPQQQHSMPSEQYAVPEDTTSRTEQIYSPQPIYPPKRLDTPKNLATPEEEFENGQFGQVSSGRPTYLAATKQVPSEIASVASIKSGTVGNPADATSVGREATPRGFASDRDYVAQYPTSNVSSYNQDYNLPPADAISVGREATEQVPSEIASIASIKSGTVGYPADATSVGREATPRGFASDGDYATQHNTSNVSSYNQDHNLAPADATSVGLEATPSGFADDGDYAAQHPTNNVSSYNQDHNLAPAGVAAGVGAAGVGAAAYSHHQRHDHDSVQNQDLYDSHRSAPMTAATYSPVDHSDDFTHPYNPAVIDTPTPPETASWERPSLMPGTYISENDIRHSGSTSYTTGPHKSKIANMLDPRVKQDKGAGKSTHEADALDQFDQKIDSNPAPGYSDRQAAPQGHRGKEAAMGAGAVGLAGAGAHHASQNSRATKEQDGYEKQTSPYSSAPLDPRVDTASRTSNPHNTVAPPTYNGDVSPMAPTFNAASTSAPYESSNTRQPPYNASSASPISPVSQQGQMVPEPHDLTATAVHSRFDSVQHGPYSNKDAEMAALGGVDADRRYSRSDVERADREYREEYQLYQKELARDQAVDDKGLESERKLHEKQLAREQKQADKDLVKSQKDHTKQMQKEAKQIQKEMDRQENGGKKKRRSGLFGFLHKDKHAHEHDAVTSGDAYKSSSDEARHSGDSGRQERHRLAKSPPAGYH